MREDANLLTPTVPTAGNGGAESGLRGSEGAKVSERAGAVRGRGGGEATPPPAVRGGEGSRMIVTP